MLHRYEPQTRREMIRNNVMSKHVGEPHALVLKAFEVNLNHQPHNLAFSHHTTQRFLQRCHKDVGGEWLQLLTLYNLQIFPPLV